MFPRTNLVLLLGLFPLLLLSQNFESEHFNTERLRINKVGMTILGSWAVGNMAVSALSLNGANAEVKAFHQMNIGWNAVNLAIASFGYYGAITDATDLSLLQSVKEHESMKAILLFNAGLDLAYIAGGFYLLERAKNDVSRESQLRGFGKSVILNGAFLFTFDVIMTYLHAHHANSTVYNIASVVRPTAQGLALNISF